MKKGCISILSLLIFTSIIFFSGCKTTEKLNMGESLKDLNLVKTSTIKPEKQRNYNKKETFYVEIRQKVEDGMFFAKRQNVILRLYGKLDKDLLTISDVYWFDNNATGWTEALFAASGQIKVLPDSSGLFKVITPVELEFVQKAKLRIKDSVLIGDMAVKTLNNKLDRINAAVEFLKTPSDYVRNPRYIDYFSFESTAGPVLFPEKYSYFGTAAAFSETENFKKHLFHDRIKWNEEYTKAAFPEYMQEVRNSGTLYRDWEQEFDLFYYLYNWEYIFGTNKNDNSFSFGTIKKKSWK